MHTIELNRNTLAKTSGNALNMSTATLPATPTIGRRVDPKGDTGLLPVVTLVLWAGCLAIGIFGFVLPYVRPHAPKVAEPMQAELLNVELTENMLPPDLLKSAAAATAPPDAVTQPDIPPPVAVAQPSAAIAFALPVEGPVRITDAKNASYAKTVATPITALPAPQRLIFGEGDGKQPRPEYPLRAQREGQEGDVGIKFVVDAGGRVTAAEISTPSLWALLNESALHTVRERWHFNPGQLRTFEILIRFKL